ncbi:hypothetical protein [Neobacillus sp. SAB-20_R2A]|uniref:hypothetical protein n=1 Tax=Neobacillus sp. SAB-20_R2A TaxID=3120519 RepID=UPI003C6E8D81
MNNSYLKLVNGLKLFSGNAELPEVFETTVSVAKNCPDFRLDVEDEIVYENVTTCYNCRYRRWNPEGFTCYKQFPNPSLEEKSR